MTFGTIMRRLGVLTCLLFILLPATARSQQLSSDTLLKALKDGLDSNRADNLVRSRGVNFVLNNDLERELRATGANDRLIATIREEGQKFAKTKEREEEATRLRGELEEQKRNVRTLIDMFRDAQERIRILELNLKGGNKLHEEERRKLEKTLEEQRKHELELVLVNRLEMETNKLEEMARAYELLLPRVQLVTAGFLGYQTMALQEKGQEEVLRELVRRFGLGQGNEEQKERVKLEEERKRAQELAKKAEPERKAAEELVKKRGEEAEKKIEELGRIYRNIRELAERGEDLLRKRDYQGALQASEAALVLCSEYNNAGASQIQIDGVLLIKGDALAALKRYAEAVETYDRVLAVNEQDGDIWYRKGLALVDSARYEEAVGSFDRALKVAPDMRAATISKGRALLKLGRHSEAIENFERGTQ